MKIKRDGILTMDRRLGGNRYLAGDYLHETISNLEAEDERDGLRNS